MAQQKNPNLKEPILPYADNHVVGEYNGISNGNVNITWVKNIHDWKASKILIKIFFYSIHKLISSYNSKIVWHKIDNNNK